MLIFQGLGPRDEPFPMEARTTVFFMFKRVLVTICAHDSLSVQRVRARLVYTKVKPPGSPMLLAHLMVDTMIDRFLAIREPMAKLLTTLQDDLLAPRTRSEERRVGKEGVRRCRSRWSPSH